MIKMAFAFSPSQNKNLYIGNENHPDDIVCIDCNQPVNARKGNIRQHHFAHNPNQTECTLSAETALHLNSKLFLHEQLSNGIDIKLYLPLEVIQDSFVQNSFRRIGLQKIPIFVSEFLNFVMPSHVIEKKIVENYIPDVSTIFGDKVVIAWEIFVTSAIDEQKLQYYQNHKIPFIELIPNINENSKNLSFEFTINNYGHINLIPEKFNLFLDEQFSDCAAATIDFTLKNLQEIIFNKLKFCGIHKKLPTCNVVSLLSEFMSSNSFHHINQSYDFSNYANIVEEPLIDFCIKKSKHGQGFCLNDKYLGLQTNLTAELILYLSNVFDALFWVGTDGKMLGLSFTIFDSNFTVHKIKIPFLNELVSLLIKIDNVQFLKENDNSTKLKLISTRAVYNEELKQFSDAYVYISQMDELLLLIFKSLSAIPNSLIKLDVANKDGKPKKVIGFSIQGIYPAHRLETAISHRIAQFFSELASATESPNIKIEKAQ